MTQIFWPTRLLLGLIASYVALPAHAVIFDNGAVNNVDYFAGASSVENSSSNQPTTLNALAGAEFSTLNARDTSIANFFSGSVVTQRISSTDQSLVTVFGGSFETTVMDAGDQSTFIINGGTFTAASTNVLRVFNQASMTINGGSFTNPGSSPNVLIVTQDGSATITGGLFTGNRIYSGRATDTGRLTISGGVFVNQPGDGLMQISNNYNSVTTIYGRSFNLPFGEITTVFNGTLIGTLANGDGINVNLVNNRQFQSDSAKIVLVQSPIPEPGTVMLFCGGLALLVARTSRRVASIAASNAGSASSAT